MQLGSFKAWITVDNIELPEHSVQISADGKQVTCWIASEAGKNFTVCWTDSFLSARKHPAGRNIQPTCKRSSFKTSSTTERPLLFSNLELTDDDAYLHNTGSSELGDIKLIINEVKFLARNRRAPRYKPLPEPDKIHEKTKKAMGHRVKLGIEVGCAPSYNVESSPIRMIGSFVFKYRPLAQLQANGIIPLEKKRKRAMDPVAVLDLSIDNDDNDTAEADRIKKLEKELASLKQRQSQRSKKVKVEVKPEVKAEPSSLSSGRRQLGDIIDLT
ncbi:hypothetical protein Hypma_012581 [Hypsizygus marmoreus]|uniref:DUF7918 domain-containing protein n=1 Tax=Hypsizygus marmoreus TaxID=39966 RepID=A0A369JN94_HYPMA|nr:hypothetical protein Hypma_012581 [Hypsizygus marmoreus]